MRLLTVAIACGLALAGLAFVPTASATCMEVHNGAVFLTCLVCPVAAATELACGVERSLNGYVSCFLDTAPSQWLAVCV